MPELQLLKTGVPNLDAVLGGGVPVFSLNIIAGAPGTGKTILAHQILFTHVWANRAVNVLYLTTLSEPLMKVVRYMQGFSFFDADAFGKQVHYQDLGRIIRDHALPEVLDYLMGLVEEYGPAILVIDSFRAIRDLSADRGAFRRFCYDLSVRLANARCTCFLVGEYDRSELARGAEFAVADGIVYVDTAYWEGEPRRMLHTYKMRGHAIEMIPYPFVITSDGLRILSPNLLLRQQGVDQGGERARVTTGIIGLDALLYGGLFQGRSVLLSGVSGTGKTTLALQFLVRGACQGEIGLLFSFEESPGLLTRVAEGFGWDLQSLEAQGLLRLIHVPQTDIRVEELLDRMIQEVTALQPRRFVVDSFSMFLYRMQDATMQREKAAQLTTMIQQHGVVGLLLSDIPAEESHRLSRIGVEETVADGVIVLSTEKVDLERRRYLEIHKMRGIAHVSGCHRMDITERGLEVYYAAPHTTPRDSERPLRFSVVESLITAPLTFGTSWLVMGEAAAGKSCLAVQFAAEGLQQEESVLYIALEETLSQLRRRLEAFGVDLTAAEHNNRFRVLYPAPVGVLDLGDDRQRMYHYMTQLRELPPPVRIVVDSITSVALRAGHDTFRVIEERMIRELTHQDSAFFLTVHRDSLSPEDRSILTGLFDVALDLYTPNWGEMRLAGNTGYRVLQVRKARAIPASARPYPYTMSPTAGVVVEKDYYRRHLAEG